MNFAPTKNWFCNSTEKEKRPALYILRAGQDFAAHPFFDKHISGRRSDRLLLSGYSAAHRKFR